MIHDVLLCQVGEALRAALPSQECDDQTVRALTQGLIDRGLLRRSNRYGKFDYLPQEVVDNLARIRDEAIAQGPKSLPYQQLNYYLHQLHGAGWTLESLGAALRVTRERVRQRIAKAVRVPLDVPVIGPPPPPEHLPAAPLPAPTRPEIPEQEVAELLRLHTIAVRYRGHMLSTSAPAVAGRDLADLMNKLVTEDGITPNTIAKAMGLTRNSVTLRLGRYGYRDLPPSQRAGQPAA